MTWRCCRKPAKKLIKRPARRPTACSVRRRRTPPGTNFCRGKSTCSRASRATARRISACRKLLPERGLEFLAEFHELVGIDVAHRPEIEAVLAPAPHIEAVQALHHRAALAGTRRRRAEQIDDVHAAAIDDGGDRLGIDIIEPAAACTSSIC